MSRAMVLSLRNAVTHNVVQQFVAGESTKDEIYEYLNAVAEYLLNDPVAEVVGITLDDVHEIILHAWNEGPEEVRVLKAMNEKYELNLTVGGHGASQVHPSVALAGWIR